MRTHRNTGARRYRLPIAAALCAAACPLARATSWWLPANYAEHGMAMDNLFNWIFGLTSVVMLGTFAAMLYFMVKYRRRRRADGEREPKAHFSHGNPKLEMVWTIVPAVILIFVSLYSKVVWDEYRFGKPDETRKPATILIVGEQFAWNAIHAGADGKIGRYLYYPRPGDRLWPIGPDGQPFTFTYNKYNDTTGPADMPYADALGAIGEYITSTNRFGKAYDFAPGKDDVLNDGDPVYLPLGRPVKLQVTSKDVIHSFNLPNFRVRLDAVPGLRGTLTFVPIGATSRQREEDPANRIKFDDPDKLKDFVSTLNHPENQNLLIRIDPDTAVKAKDGKSGAVLDKTPEGKRWRYNVNPGGQWKYVGADGKTVIRDRGVISGENAEAVVKALKAIGVKEVTLCRSGAFEVACTELCGTNHYKMQSQAIVLSAEEYAERFEAPPEEARAAPAPGEALAAAARK